MAVIVAALALPAIAQEAPINQRMIEEQFRQHEQRRAQRRQQARQPVATQQRQRRPAASGPAVAAAPSPQAVEKLENARVVLVVGDFIGGGLAEGLVEVYAQSPGVRVVSRTNGSSGLVRDDFYDWPGEIGGILEAESPYIVVVALGSNDRQQMRTPEGREAVRTEAWVREYERRAAALAERVKESGAPLIWVGMPPFRLQGMSSDMLALNDIFRNAAEAADGQFVDIWDGFVDEDGAFVTSGPDVQGQTARLRAGDGINMTAAGKRKMAFYAEKPLNRILGDAILPDIGQVDVANLPALMLPSLGGLDGLSESGRTMPISLAGPEIDGGQELLGLDPPRGATAGPRGANEGLSDHNDAPKPRPGRVDDFGWRPPVPSRPSPDPEATTAIRP